MHDVRVAEARVQRSRALDTLEGAVDGRKRKPLRLLGARLQIRLVDLHDVRARGEQVAHLLVHGRRERHRQRLLVVVVVVLRLLRHRERSRQRGLDLARGAGAKKLDVAHLDRPRAADRADHSRHRVRMAGAVERRAGVVEVHPLERCREAVGVALAPDLAVRDDVDPRSLHVADRDHRRVVLRLLQQLWCDSPDLQRPRARWEPAPEHFPIDQPVRLRVAADHRRGQEFRHASKVNLCLDGDQHQPARRRYVRTGLDLGARDRSRAVGGDKAHFRRRVGAPVPQAARGLVLL